MASPPAMKKRCSAADKLEDLNKDELILMLREKQNHVNDVDSRLSSTQDGQACHSSSSGGGGGAVSKTCSEDCGQLKKLLADASRRENVLVAKVTSKDQEISELVAQLEETKRGQTAGVQQLRSMQLDPAVALMVGQLRRGLDDARSRAEQAQTELSAWKFTPDSQTGKRLMARCRQLLTENEELGTMISSGKTARLEGDAALQKQLVTELRGAQGELEELVTDLDEDLEGLQGALLQTQGALSSERQRSADLTGQCDALRAQLQTVSLAPAAQQPPPPAATGTVGTASSSSSSSAPSEGVAGGGPGSPSHVPESSAAPARHPASPSTTQANGHEPSSAEVHSQEGGCSPRRTADTSWAGGERTPQTPSSSSPAVRGGSPPPAPGEGGGEGREAMNNGREEPMDESDSEPQTTGRVDKGDMEADSTADSSYRTN